MDKFRPEPCPRCGKPTKELREGRIVYLRCKCEWEREHHDRIVRTIHPEYWKPKPKLMVDWNPPLFSKGGWREYVEVQKVMAVGKLHLFGFDEREGTSGMALKANASRGRNLFVRGPAGSGRGLLAATLKMAASLKGLPVTPLPNDYDILKGYLAQALEYGATGDAARVALFSRFEEPLLMVVEDARAELRYQYRDGTEKTRRIRGHDFLDALLARRAGRPGSLIMTSSSFIGEIRDSMGDRMQDVLCSPKTNVVAMLAPDEAADLKVALSERSRKFRDLGMRLMDAPEDKGRTRTEKMTDEEEADLLAEGLYFEEAFPSAGSGIQVLCETGLDQIQQAGLAMKVWSRFAEAREAKSAEYKEGLEAARVAAVEDCRSLAKKLSPREKEEVGKVMAYAAKVDASDPGDKLLSSWREKAEERKRVMSGKAQ